MHMVFAVMILAILNRWNNQLSMNIVIYNFIVTGCLEFWKTRKSQEIYQR